MEDTNKRIMEDNPSTLVGLDYVEDTKLAIENACDRINHELDLYSKNMTNPRPYERERLHLLLYGETVSLKLASDSLQSYDEMEEVFTTVYGH
eukprot:2771165-Rhodomonas_salina.1